MKFNPLAAALLAGSTFAQHATEPDVKAAQITGHAAEDLNALFNSALQDQSLYGREEQTFGLIKELIDQFLGFFKGGGGGPTITVTKKPITITITKGGYGRTTTITKTKTTGCNDYGPTVTITKTKTKCDDYGGRTKTVTVTKTKPTTVTTTKSVCPSGCPTPTCGDHGVRYARYNNPFEGDYSSDYDSFNLTYFESQEPVDTGITNTIYLETDSSNSTFAHAALEYRTYLYACKAGTYTFTSPSADDATLMWFGEENTRDSTRDNADIKQFYYGDNSAKTVEKTIDADTYYPIRILWGNTEGAGFLDLQIYGPDGNKLTGGSDSSKESYLVTESCDSGYNPYGSAGRNGKDGFGQGRGNGLGHGDGHGHNGKGSGNGNGHNGNGNGSGEFGNGNGGKGNGNGNGNGESGNGNGEFGNGNGGKGNGKGGKHGSGGGSYGYGQSYGGDSSNSDNSGNDDNSSSGKNTYYTYDFNTGPGNKLTYKITVSGGKTCTKETDGTQLSESQLQALANKCGK